VIDGNRIDEYVTRMGEVRSALDEAGWNAIRNDEWASPLGDTIRFSYANQEFRIHLNFINQEPEWHSIRVREAAEAHVPTVEELLHSIIDVNRAAWNRNHGAYQQLTTRKQPGGVASQPLA
jgi:hypothetical protein